MKQAVEAKAPAKENNYKKINLLDSVGCVLWKFLETNLESKTRPFRTESKSQVSLPKQMLPVDLLVQKERRERNTSLCPPRPRIFKKFTKQ